MPGGPGRFAEPWLLVLMSLADGPSMATRSWPTSLTSAASAWSRTPCTGRCPGQAWQAVRGTPV